jgi:hypothetical protein
MEKTGLPSKYVDKILKHTKQLDAGRKNFHIEGQEAAGRVLFTAGVTGLLETFKEIQATKDPQLIFAAEKVFLQQEMQFCDPSDRFTIKHLETSDIYLDDAMNAVETAKSKKAYRHAETTHPTLGRGKDGVPPDVVHKACDKNSDRLLRDNKTPGLSTLEKDLLHQRRANLATAKEAYIEMQKEALGLPKDAKVKSNKSREI